MFYFNFKIFIKKDFSNKFCNHKIKLTNNLVIIMLQLLINKIYKIKRVHQTQNFFLLKF